MSTPAPAPADLTYGGYLRIPELLSLQRPLSRPESHDELQFIIVHQTFELWFRLMLHEVDAIFEHLAADRTLEAARLFTRLSAIVRTFFPALEVLETMVPSDFLAFRDLLKPASGFQSFQFRELEFASGVRDERFLKVFEGNPEALRRLQARLKARTLWEAFADHLKRKGYSVGAESEQRASIVAIYKTGHEFELRALCEAMIQYDEDFQLYREHHVRMAERMIGDKFGTGVASLQTVGYSGPMGIHGVEYLRKTLSKKFFPVLWSARTEM